MIEVQRYNKENQKEWDEFIDNSKNGTFLFKRNFMDYHSDRFQDFSLMFKEDQTIIALLPASLHKNEVRSHGGLTYGGVISDRKMTAQKMLEVFDALNAFLKKENIQKILYKRVPYIYYTYPSDEDLYALFRTNAKLVRRDVSTSIYLKDKISFSSRRNRNIKKAGKAQLMVRESKDFQSYLDILTKALAVHHAKPVHSEEELKLLASRFPEEIKLFASFKEDKMLAGVLIFETKNVIHCQYIANSEEGRSIGALDLVFDYLINDYAIKKEKNYFDFGISNEDDGRFLNIGLITQKQEFGGRAVVHDFYEWEIV